MTELAQVAGGKTRAVANWTIQVATPHEDDYRRVFYLRLKRDLLGARFHFSEPETVLAAEFKALNLDLKKASETVLPAALKPQDDLEVVTVTWGRPVALQLASGTGTVEVLLPEGSGFSATALAGTRRVGSRLHLPSG